MRSACLQDAICLQNKNNHRPQDSIDYATINPAGVFLILRAIFKTSGLFNVLRHVLNYFIHDEFGNLYDTEKMKIAIKSYFNTTDILLKVRSIL